MGSGMSASSAAGQLHKPSVSTDPSVLTEDNTGLPSKFNLLDWSMNATTSIRRQVWTSWTQLHATHWAMIRHLALTVSYVCLKLVCFQSTRTYSALEVSDYYALYKFTTYLLTYRRLDMAVAQSQNSRLWQNFVTSPHSQWPYTHVQYLSAVAVRATGYMTSSGMCQL